MPPTLDLRFCYGHRLLNYSGKCRRLHGHTARARLQLAQPATPAELELQQERMSAWVRESLDARMILCRHDPALELLRELGEPVMVVDQNPTTELLAQLLYRAARRLELPVSESRVWESPRCSATYLPTPGASE